MVYLSHSEQDEHAYGIMEKILNAYEQTNHEKEMFIVNLTKSTIV